MGLSINSSNTAIQAARQLQKTTKSLFETNKQLASALRINTAADDAAGLSIAEQLRADVRQSNQEASNLQSGISAAQTADGGLESQGEAVGRLRELAVQASNGTLSSDQRDAINTEAQQLVQQIDSTAQGTQYNGTNLLGSNQSVTLGTDGGDQLSLGASTSASLGVSGINLSTPGGAQSAISTLDTAADRINQNRASLGAQQNAFTSAINTRETASENAADSESRIRDADVAQLAIKQARNQILLGAGVTAIRNSGINSENASRLLAK